jgi:hypothetical protein
VAAGLQRAARRTASRLAGALSPASRHALARLMPNTARRASPWALRARAGSIEDRGTRTVRHPSRRSTGMHRLRIEPDSAAGRLARSDAATRVLARAKKRGARLTWRTARTSSAPARGCAVTLPARRGAGKPGRRVPRRGWGGTGGAAPAPNASCVGWLQQRRHRAADDDLAADHLGPLDPEMAELSAHELKRPLV